MVEADAVQNPGPTTTQGAGEAEPGEEILRLNGSVVSASEPGVEVLVGEMTSLGAQRTKVLMDYGPFAAAGILERGMRFVFRTVRRGNKLISEVTPAQGDTDLFMAAEADPALAPILEAERGHVQKLLDSAERPRDPVQVP